MERLESRGLGRKVKKTAKLAALAVLIEITVFQFSFWSTLFAKGTSPGQAEVLWEYVAIEEMESAAAGGDGVYVDGQGYTHALQGAALLRIKGLDRKVARLHVALDIPPGYVVKATVFAQDEGNAYTYQLGEPRTLLAKIPENGWMKIYPYGKVKNLYLRLETANRKGEASAGDMGDLVCRVGEIRLDGRMPFVFRPLRLLLVFALLLLCCGFGKKEGACLPFWANEKEGRRKRLLWMAAYMVLFIAAAFFFVRINPDCKKNLALHHAQYQELARALAKGNVSVGEASPELLGVDNPYDTIFLQAKQIPYQADYAYYKGNYYVYFGIVPELLLYLPYYLLTGKDLPNYLAVFFFFAGFVIASAGLVFEWMRRYCKDSPCYLYFVAVFMLVGSPSLFYLLLRPDLYHVPIIASCMFTAAGLWGYLAGMRRERGKEAYYAWGSLCMALTAGCRPQFLLFSLLAVPLLGKEWFSFSGKRDEGKRVPPLRVDIRRLSAFVVPYLAVGAGLMYYNALRFGSPFDFGAAYSMTSNDMTHRGVNLERILYGMWYFLFQPPQLEAQFPYLQSAAVQTDYMGKMVFESWFGGIFACSLLTWPVFLLHRMGRQFADRSAFWMAVMSVGVAVAICAVDASGAGILQRYGSDVSFGIYLGAVPALLAGERWARRQKMESAFCLFLKTACLLHVAFLFLVLIQDEGSVNLLTGNPVLFYRIQAALRF